VKDEHDEERSVLFWFGEGECHSDDKLSVVSMLLDE
jgi:hypothetical protein